MKDNQTTVHTPNDLLNELHTLVGEVEAMMADPGSEHSADAVGHLHARFCAAQERFAHLYNGAKKKIIAGARYTDTRIRENPYQSLAIALGVGLLVGVLLGRRSK